MSKTYYGLGRQIDNGTDRFVLNRFLNFLALAFNQRIKNDLTREKFFNLNSASPWTLSKENECYVCNKHTMTVIFYDRNFMALNEDLVRVKNKEFVQKLK